MKQSSLLTGICLASLCSLSHVPAALAQDDSGRLGSVRFETSCNEIAQRRFDRAMRYEHSFWYSAANEIFGEAIKADPSCGIAHWGVALTLLNNPHSPIPAANLPLGLAAIEKARQVGAKTQRERDIINSLAEMYVDYDKLDHRTRILRYLAAMEQLAGKYPEDDELQLLYAITLNTSASPNDKTYANQLKGAQIVERVMTRQPNHPGVPHYLIHLYDYPAIAEKGIPAALRYAQVAPDAPHAQHMPSHIFTRIGYWQESIASNLASAKAAKASKEYSDQMHGTDYLVYAYLQQARDKQAEAAVAEQTETYNLSNNVIRVNAGAYALAAGPARYAVERGDWRSAAQLQVRDSPLRHTMALTHFARALGAARSQDSVAAHADIAALTQIRDQLREAKDGYWSEIVDIQRQIAAAWLMAANGDKEAALAAMSAAADAEDKTEKSPVTPGPLAPARELYGAMLMEANKPSEALSAFEATLQKEPNRFNAYAGAAQAAEKAGNIDKAKAHFAKLLELARDGTGDRPALAEARLLMAR